MLTKDIKAQDTGRMVRIAKINVDPAQLVVFRAALTAQMNAAISKEPGVLSYHAVADKKDPAQITILEVYASRAAYLSHIETTHFKKYKETVKDMVKSLELLDVETIGYLSK